MKFVRLAQKCRARWIFCACTRNAVRFKHFWEFVWGKICGCASMFKFFCKPQGDAISCVKFQLQCSMFFVTYLRMRGIFHLYSLQEETVQRKLYP